MIRLFIQWILISREKEEEEKVILGQLEIETLRKKNEELKNERKNQFEKKMYHLQKDMEVKQQKTVEEIVREKEKLKKAEEEKLNIEKERSEVKNKFNAAKENIDTELNDVNNGSMRKLFFDTFLKGAKEVAKVVILKVVPKVLGWAAKVLTKII